MSSPSLPKAFLPLSFIPNVLQNFAKADSKATSLHDWRWQRHHRSLPTFQIAALGILIQNESIRYQRRKKAIHPYDIKSNSYYPNFPDERTNKQFNPLRVVDSPYAYQRSWDVPAMMAARILVGKVQLF